MVNIRWQLAVNIFCLVTFATATVLLHILEKKLCESADKVDFNVNGRLQVVHASLINFLAFFLMRNWRSPLMWVHCKSTYFYIRALRHIRQTLSTDDAKTVASALVGSRLDYANSIIYDASAANICKLQRIHNSLVRVVTCSKPRSDATRLLKDLHWLPIKHRINFKIVT